MRTLDTDADIADGLAWLAKADLRLRPVMAKAGVVATRRRPAGFGGVAEIIVSQQVSAASANAIWRRVDAAFPDIDPKAVAAATDDALRAVGLSAPKIRTLRAVADACLTGLELDALATMPADEARMRLVAINGIGPWSADIYLLFCLGHADIFPAGDLALRNAMATAFQLDPVPSVAEAREIAVAWAPWRGAAALLFWAYHHAIAAERRATPREQMTA